MYKVKRRSSIRIEFSLKYLETRHMGYQDNIVEENYNRKDRKRRGQSVNNNSNKGQQGSGNNNNSNNNRRINQRNEG